MDAQADIWIDNCLVCYLFRWFVIKSTHVNEILKESCCSTVACHSYSYVRVCHILVAYVLLLFF